MRRSVNLFGNPRPVRSLFCGAVVLPIAAVVLAGCGTDGAVPPRAAPVGTPATLASGHPDGPTASQPK
ncbi:MAG: hypothetical protein ACLQVD_18420 [Capsulimonadaceae bacterium]